MLTVERSTFTDTCTLGELCIDGEFFCHTLEDTCRRNKIPGKTAIPAGRYEIVDSYSPKFGRNMPHLLNVPGFEGIRIHVGNRPEDTEGCILVGMKKGDGEIFDSRKAFDLLHQEIKKRLEFGKVYISVIGGIHASI